jgi:myosin-crossreactive antigen
MVFTVMPAVRFSKNGMRDFFPFIWAWIVEQTAFHVGEWQSIVEIRRAEHRLRTQSQPG